MKKIIDIYSDGACSGNPGPGGAAAILVCGQEEAAHKAKGYFKTTNQRMEIAAAAIGVRLAAIYVRVERGEYSVVLHTDSQYVVSTMTKGWQRKANLDLWRILDKAIADLAAVVGQDAISFEWVKGHAGNAWNNAADRLAVQAAGVPTQEDAGYVTEKMPDLFSQPETIPAPAPAPAASYATTAPEAAPQPLAVVTDIGRRLLVERFTVAGTAYLLLADAQGNIIGAVKA